ncbi:MAG: S16 family serine protease [Methanobacteriota archaeon]
MKKYFVFLLSFFLGVSSVSSISIGVSTGQISTGQVTIHYRNITMYAPAVANTDSGYIGVISTITVTIQDNGTGRVFVDTLPLTQIDMQGSARLAVKVARTYVENDKTSNISTEQYDYFVVVRTESSVIGGPSAGAVMTVATIALLENWTVDSKTVMTGMINPDGTIGPIGGIQYKIDAANSVGATRFLVPKGQITYTEMVTETIIQNGWRQIITRPVTKNISEYALDNYGIEAFEVEDINDALRYMTGYVFETPTSDGNVTTEKYIESMKPLAEMLLANATSSFENASTTFNHSDIPNRYPFYYKNQITDILNDAEKNLQEASLWFDQEVYYTATSKSFQSLIDSLFVSYACGYFAADDEQAYIETIMTEASNLFTNKSNEAKNAAITGAISLQCVGAAQERVTEAEEYLTGAQNDFTNNDYLTALYKISFASQRSESVGWWLRIASYYNDTGEITNTTVQDLAEEYIEDAQQSITYATVLLEEIGTSSQYLSDAEALLTSANKNRDEGYPAAALFEALEALVKGNLALELVDSAATDRVMRAEERARTSIEESRNRGVEPVLAVSYYEYAQSLENESAFDNALVYYKYADLIAGAISFTHIGGGGSSRYVGIPEVSTPSWWSGRMFDYTFSTLLFFVLGIVAGFGIGLILWGASSKKQKKKYSYNEWMPRSIEDYYKKQK